MKAPEHRRRELVEQVAQRTVHQRLIPGHCKIVCKLSSSSTS
jgi:hypothetical protein